MTLIAQAGAIAVKRVDGVDKFLLVTSKQTPTDWIFPKGKIERGESAEEAALRELQEESGFEGTIIALAGSAEYQSRRGPAHVDYFVANASERTGEGDGRQFQWLAYDAAKRTLTHEDSRRLLDRAVELRIQQK